MKRYSMEAIKSEAKLYRNIKTEFKDYEGNIVKPIEEFSGTTREALDKLIQRRTLLGALLNDKTPENEKKNYYKQLDENDKYFMNLSEQQRKEIKESLNAVKDSTARTKEWQGLRMAFDTTENLRIMEEIEAFKKTLEDLQGRRKQMLKIKKEINEKIEKYEKEIPDVTFENAKEKKEEYEKKYEEMKQNKTNALNKLNKFRGSKVVKESEKRYKELQSENKYLKAKKEIYERAYKEVQKDPEYLEYVPSEKLDELIKKQEETIQTEKQTLINQSSEIKAYMEYSETVNREDFELLQNFEDMIRDMHEKYSEGIFYPRVPTIGILKEKMWAAEDAKYKDKFQSYKEAFADLRHKNNPNYQEAKEDLKKYPEGWKYYNFLNKIEDCTLDEAISIIDDVWNQVSKDRREKLKVRFEQLSENEKKLITEFSEKRDKANKQRKQLIDIKEKNIRYAKERISDIIKYNNYTQKEAEESFQRECNRLLGTFVNGKIAKIAKEMEGDDVGRKYEIPFETTQTTRSDSFIKLEIQNIEANIPNMEREQKEYEQKVNGIAKTIASLQTEFSKARDAEIESLTKLNYVKNMVDPANGFNINKYKQQYTNAPKLDTSKIIETTKSFATMLWEKQKEFAENHSNSKEFNKMIKALEIVKEWGNVGHLTEGMKNPPKTYDEALEQLKTSSQEYLKAKNRQFRPRPTQLRTTRKELANSIEFLVDLMQSGMEDEKVVESWNKFFESRGKEPVIKKQDKVVGKETKQISEPNTVEKKEEKRREEVVFEKALSML